MKIRLVAIGLLLMGVFVLLLIEGSYSQSKKDAPFLAKEPALITSAGQSADVQMVRVLADRNKISYKFNPVAGAETLKEVKSVLIVIGGSTKGLGAAGIDANKELGRVQQILIKAREMNLPLIGIHIGGKARRGELSDQFIQLVAPKVSYLLVLKEGDADEIFSKTASKNGIPITFVGKISEAQEPLKTIYSK